MTYLNFQNALPGTRVVPRTADYRQLFNELYGDDDCSKALHESRIGLETTIKEERGKYIEDTEGYLWEKPHLMSADSIKTVIFTHIRRGRLEDEDDQIVAFAKNLYDARELAGIPVTDDTFLVTCDEPSGHRRHVITLFLGAR